VFYDFKGIQRYNKMLFIHIIMINIIILILIMMIILMMIIITTINSNYSIISATNSDSNKLKNYCYEI